MEPIYEFLQRTGMQSLDTFWFPMLIWTMVAAVVFVGIRLFDRMNPLYHYHLRAATLAAIPFGLLATFGLYSLSTSSTGSTGFDPAVFVLETPQTFTIPEVAAGSFSPNWFDPNFLLGTATILVLMVSAIMLIRLAFSYRSLKRLHATLTKFDVTDLTAFGESRYGHVKIAFHEHPLVPFTFGWKKPIIVLPMSIHDDPEKVRMAVQHELVHIKRGDYLLQLFLSVIENLFWFHPLIKLGAREIETYREISCDQEVLNTSGISLKKYATMLYELLPLNRGLGSFSVSMAVQQSTLKKRITTMKYHTIYKTSIRRSIFFLFVMILGVTVPIACSDLRGPEGLSDEEMINTNMIINQPVLSVNGKEVAVLTNIENTMPLPSGMSIGTKEYGTLTISGTQFEGAKKTAFLDGNMIRYTENELNFELVNQEDFLKEGSVELWALHQPERRATGMSISYAPASAMMDGSYLGSLSPELRNDLFTENEDFVVVEEMPKLIGGMASVQSKVVYPEMARRAGIEGRVTVQFIVNKNGDVENPQVIRGIGGGCDEAALEAISQAKFEPGIQRGRPVRVQYSLPIVFRLSDSDFTDAGERP